MYTTSLHPRKIILSAGAAALPAAEVQTALERHLAGDCGILHTNPRRRLSRAHNHGYDSMYPLTCGCTVCIHTDPMQSTTVIYLPRE